MELIILNVFLSKVKNIIINGYYTTTPNTSLTNAPIPNVTNATDTFNIAISRNYNVILRLY